MSSDEIKLEAAYERLIEEDIKSQLEKNGTMALLRSEMHVKVLQMMRGQLNVSKPKPLKGGLSNGTNLSEDQSLIKLINQLVMEFFHWFGYKHTLETFRMETGEIVANRIEMEQSLLITPESKDLPLLAQLVMRDWKLNGDTVGPKKVVQLPDPLNSMPQRCLKLKEELQALRKQKVVKGKVQQEVKLVQYNRKLIDNDPFRTPKKTSPPTRFLKKDSSESDILESDYSEYESEDSDAYKDIPDRQFFIDDLPPEGKYAPGHGEEGSEGLFQQYKGDINTDNIPSSSKQSTISRRPKDPPNEGSESGDKASICRKEKGSRKNYWNSPRRLQHQSKSDFKSDDDELVPAVTKQKCPDTHIGKIDLDSDYSFDDD
ncbi:uncharacterized protein LOC119557976 [Drosophila subpulchrella]|uniref:uncharacterized protein LOC119557976 n=1 Tax=Drosophila subpulchrella TaxID=1486046 RepID=UPI0018A13A78|nr:uncharacterized protein LOC119557976 [Drosophila subpulchrella]